MGIVMFNRDNATKLTLFFDDIGDGETQCWTVYDLWKSMTLGKRCYSIELSVPGPGVRFLRVFQWDPHLHLHRAI